MFFLWLSTSCQVQTRAKFSVKNWIMRKSGNKEEKKYRDN
ncbi:Protein CBG25620 [Caenorhabditis briggsae]|uniref:Protein CBG25620 n=1 Tax=Caenorhabditis briggsae TaxID=6238 RepID=B6IFA5_CAEBR|nr:Protein CBG25620 [Caenorhabditis briggsae]CAR98585.1 Protein CBG25620 [Caenorhabditis briggsae]